MKELWHYYFEVHELQKYFITTHPSGKLLSVKRAEQIRIPSSGLFDIVFDIVETVCPVVENFGDDEGSFPRRSKLVLFLLIHSEN